MCAATEQDGTMIPAATDGTIIPDGSSPGAGYN